MTNAAKLGKPINKNASRNTQVDVRSSTHSETERYALKQRVLNVSRNLPADYVDLICIADTSLDNKKGRDLIKNVKSLKTANEHVTVLMERVAESFKQLQANLQS